jgi:hypothetical protein
MRFALYGLLLAAVLFVITGGHLVFLPLFFMVPLGGLFGHRRRGTYGLRGGFGPRRGGYGRRGGFGRWGS